MITNVSDLYIVHLNERQMYVYEFVYLMYRHCLQAFLFVEYIVH